MRDLSHEAEEYARRRVRLLRKAVAADFADMNRGIATVLRGGVLLSVGILLAGLAIAAIEGTGFQALLSLGVLTLLLTPVVRVALSLVGFLKGRDGTYVALTAIVLLNLAAAFLIGIL